MEYALAAITAQIIILEGDKGEVTGSLRMRSGAVNKEVIERTYACKAQESAERGYTDWICLVEFDRNQPDWAALLLEMDSVGLMSPPADPPPPPLSGCLDGTPWTLTVVDIETGNPMVQERQTCPPAVTPARRQFEMVMESVIDHVLQLAQD